VAVLPAPSPANDGPLIVESKYKHADKAEMAAKEKQADAERQSQREHDAEQQRQAKAQGEPSKHGPIL